MKPFFLRAVTALLYGLLVISALRWSAYSFAGLIVAVNIFCLSEFYSLAGFEKRRSFRWIGVAASTLFLLPQVFLLRDHQTEHYAPLLALTLLFLSLLSGLAVRPFATLSDTAHLLGGMLYVTLPLYLLFLTGFQSDGSFHYRPDVLLGFFILNWTNDTFAYAAGTFLGKNLLLPAISPKKTWEGLAGGVLLTLTAGWVIGRYATSIPPYDWWCMAALVALFGTLGDLVQSAFKRSAGVKDTGKILPGHGGVLDRFDAILMSAPFVYVYLRM